jgi:hypothetical protein
MSDEAEQGGGLGRATAFVLVLVTLLCIGLIGSAGFVKFKLDQSAYALASAAEEAPTVEDRRAHLLAERDLHVWSLSLTLISWISLILTAGLITSTYLILQRRQSPALRALSQSITNLARGDMQTPIWGIERHDPVGELARAVDLARYHFSQLPDMSLLSDQGPVRIKFEGGTRTLFEAMMQQITAQAGRIGDEAADLAASAASQHKVISELPVRLNAAMEQLQTYGRTNAQVIQNAAQGLTSASGQLDKLVPFMQSRAQSMAEVTQIAGTQVTTVLRNLLETEHTLRDSTGKSQVAVDALASQTKDIGERIFAALNLLQASGKVLNETTEVSQSRLKEMLDLLGTNGSKFDAVIGRVEQRLEATVNAEANLSTLSERTSSNSERLDNVLQSITERHDKLGEQISHAAQKLDEIVVGVEGARTAMSEALQNISRDGSLLGSVFQELKTGNEQVLAKLTRTSETGHEVVQHLSERSEAILQQLHERLASQTQQNQDMTAVAAATTKTLSNTVGVLEQAQDKFQNIHARFADALDHMGGALERQVVATFGKTEALAQQSHDKLSALTASVDQALQRLTVLGQLTSTLGTVAGQLGQIIPSLNDNGHDRAQAASVPMPAFDVTAITDGLAHSFSTLSNNLLNQIRALPAPGDATPEIDVSALSEKLLSEFEDKWRSSVNQIDSIRDDLAMLLEKQKDQLELRLVILDKQVKAIPTNHDADPHQISLLQEIVATLCAMNEHMTKLEATKEVLSKSA